MPAPVRVVPLMAGLGEAAGHRLVVLSLEVYDEFADLRFARIDEAGDHRLPRRIPDTDAWRITDGDGFPFRVADVAGRGDRSFSNGEVRLEPTPPVDATTLHVRVELAPGHDPLEGTLPLDA